MRKTRFGGINYFIYFVLAFFIVCFFYFIIFRRRFGLLEGANTMRPNMDITDTLLNTQGKIVAEKDPKKQLRLIDDALGLDFLVKKINKPPSDVTRWNDTISTIKRIRKRITETSGPSPGTSGPSPGTSGPSPGTSGPSPGTSGPSPGTSGPSPGTFAPTSGPISGTSGTPPGTSDTGPGNVDPTFDEMAQENTE